MLDFNCFKSSILLFERNKNISQMTKSKPKQVAAQIDYRFFSAGANLHETAQCILPKQDIVVRSTVDVQINGAAHIVTIGDEPIPQI